MGGDPIVYDYPKETMQDVKLENGGDSRSSIASSSMQVVGSTNLYEDGKIRLVPMPTPDPRDPLNLPKWRKVAAIISVCFFGALALSAETIIGALIPVFALEYAGIDPKILAEIDLSALQPKGVVNLNPLELLSQLGGPPLWKVSLLASLPLLTNGISSYFLVPLSIAIGRRPVLLACGVMAWSGGFWAGFSTSLPSHIAARCVQALGAGAVEALIPLIVQDIVFIHDRNKAVSSIWSTQGIIIVSLGIASPIVVADLGWRYLYYITSSLAIVAWLGVVFCLPETRWIRSPLEYNGRTNNYIPPGENRPRIDVATYGRRTRKDDWGVFQNGYEPKLAIRSMIETVRTMTFPNILWVIMVNGIFISIQGAAGQTGSSVLIASGWKFKTLGLAVLPVVCATPFVWFLGGFLADKISNAHAKRNGGKREPEAHLLNLILPLCFGVIGCTLFGYAAQNVLKVSTFVLLFGIFLIGLSFLTANTVFSVYIVESYPQWAGPVLVNVSSFRCIIGFGMSFRATQWVQERGFLGSFAIYAGILGFLALFLPVMYIYGKRIRQYTAGDVKSSQRAAEKDGSFMEY